MAKKDGQSTIPIESTALTAQDELSNRALAMKQDAAETARQLKELGVEASDLVIPLVQLMQNTSELVSDDKAKLGDIINMQTTEKLGGFETPVKILPLKMFKTLRTYDVSNKGFKFLSEQPLTPANEKLQGEGNEKIQTEGGERSVPVKRYHTLNFFVLVKQDLERGEGFPCLVRFRSTGMNAGRTLATHLYKRIHLRKLPYSQFIELSCRKEKKDTASYAAFQIGAPSEASKEDIATAEQWLATLASVKYRVDEHEDAESDLRGEQAAKPVVMEGEVIGAPSGAY